MIKLFSVQNWSRLSFFLLRHWYSHWNKKKDVSALNTCLSRLVYTSPSQVNVSNVVMSSHKSGYENKFLNIKERQDDIRYTWSLNKDFPFPEQPNITFKKLEPLKFYQNLNHQQPPFCLTTSWFFLASVSEQVTITFRVCGTFCKRFCFWICLFFASSLCFLSVHIPGIHLLKKSILKRTNGVSLWPLLCTFDVQRH